MISNTTLGVMIFQLAAGILIPLILFLYLKKKTGLKISIFLMGAGTWFVFAAVLEAIMHSIILNGTPAGSAIMGNNFLYALYGGFMAALFEESGRYIVFRTLLKREQVDDRTSIMYGAGHGGFECFLILVSGAANLLFYSFAINNGSMMEGIEGLDEATLSQLNDAINQLAETPAYTYVFSVVERVRAIIAHIGMSIMVWFAAKEKVKEIRLLVLAYVSHFLLDFVAVLLQPHLPIILLEVIILAMALGIGYLGLLTWRRFSSPPEEIKTEGPRIGERFYAE